jgi:hypothetical protein
VNVNQCIVRFIDRQGGISDPIVVPLRSTIRMGEYQIFINSDKMIQFEGVGPWSVDDGPERQAPTMFPVNDAAQRPEPDEVRQLREERERVSQSSWR